MNFPNQKTPAQSPVSKQITGIFGQLEEMGMQIESLIDNSISALEIDPRQATAKCVDVLPASCALEGELANILRRLQGQVSMLAAINLNIRL